MRIDGRPDDALRPVEILTDYLDHAHGSCLIRCGATRVLCAATVMEGVPTWRSGSGAGWVTAEYAMLPCATNPRGQREVHHLSGRTLEIRRLIGRSLRAAVDLDALGERTVIVDCDVLQADGGTRTASITGGYVALALAILRNIAEGALQRDVFRSPVAAVSAGIVDGRPLLDLCYAEDAVAEVDFNVVMNANYEFIELQGTAEGRPFGGAMLQRLLAVAQKGIEALLAMQREAIVAWGRKHGLENLTVGGN